MGSINRREFFKSLLLQNKKSDKTKSIRPPYNSDEGLFHRYCGGCEGKCVPVCEEKIIHINEKDKVPYLDFKNSGCTFCKKCVDACDFAVLNIDDIYESVNKVNALPVIDRYGCLAWKKIICSSCRDICPDGAIKFWALWNPKVQADKCTGCGLCISVCPKEAIYINAL